MINNRNKGNQYERDFANEVEEFFPDIVTSRSESKRTDDKGVDFCYTGPFIIQAKAWERAPSYHRILKQMAKDNEGLPLIAHKRNHQGTIIAMPKDVFYMLLRAWIELKNTKDS